MPKVETSSSRDPVIEAALAVCVATDLDPKLTGEVRRSEKIKRGMQTTDKKLGRPPKPLTRNMLVRILELRGCTGRTNGPLGVHSIVRILRKRGITISDRQVQAALDLEVPDGGGEFIRLMDIDRNRVPGTGLRIVLQREKQGLIDDLLAGLADDGQERAYRKGSFTH